MWSDYEANEVAAELKYKRKQVIIRGFINDISSHNSGSSTVWVNGTNKYHRVAADFQADRVSQVGGMIKGKAVDLLCTAIGRKWLAISLEDCRVY